MLRILIGGVLVIALGALAMRQFSSSSSSPSSSGSPVDQIEDARQDINEAVDQEFQRARDLDQE